MSLLACSVRTPTFSMDTTEDGAVLTTALRGNADLRAIAPLDAVIQELDTEATRRAIRELVLDFHDLEFMNSSCFKCFVTWFSRLQEGGAEHQYRIRIRGNPDKPWQKRSFAALSCCAAELVHIEN